MTQRRGVARAETFRRASPVPTEKRDAARGPGLPFRHRDTTKQADGLSFWGPYRRRGQRARRGKEDLE
jgi:hypothetical protein